MSEKITLYHSPDQEQQYNYSGEGGTVDIRTVRAPITFSQEEIAAIKDEQAARLSDVRAQLATVAEAPVPPVKPPVTPQHNYST